MADMAAVVVVKVMEIAVEQEAANVVPEAVSAAIFRVIVLDVEATEGAENVEESLEGIQNAPSISGQGYTGLMMVGNMPE